MRQEAKIRFIVACVVLVFCAIFGSMLYFGGLIHLFLEKPEWLISIIEKHFAAIVLPPLMMVGAIVVVVALRMSEGPIKFKILGFEFEGASAPIIMWVLIYLVFTLTVKIFWGLV